MGRAPRLRRAVDPRCPAIGLRGRGSSLQDNVRRAPMNANAVAREGLRLISRLAGAVVAVPMITGYVTLGAAVAIGRSLLEDRKSTRLNSSHQIISYAVFCLEKKKNHKR